MSPAFISGLKTFQASIYACVEDFMTYFAFETEFIKLKLHIVKCQADAAINVLPAYLKQISKKTSATYATAMYTTCLGSFAGLLDTGYDATIGATLTSLTTLVQSDLLSLAEASLSCGNNLLVSSGAEQTTLLGLFTSCSPAPA